VRVVGVTKGFGPDAVRAALGAGLRDLGENYAPELVAKATSVGEAGTGGADQGADGVVAGVGVGGGGGGSDPVWHFLGAIQRNKVADLAPLVGVWQSVAREVEGERIARFAPDAAVLVQVDVTGLPGRNGCRPAQVPDLVSRLRAHGLHVRGLMTVAAPGRAAADKAFGEVTRLADRLGLPERSMGMTDDLEEAVAAGSTMVRIGRALFGERLPGATAVR
jgi:PLP dependent protein